MGRSRPAPGTLTSAMSETSMLMLVTPVAVAPFAERGREQDKLVLLPPWLAGGSPF